MKRHILFLLLIGLLSGSISLYADETFRLTGFAAWQGESDTLAITINNATDVTAFQANLMLPDGISFESVSLSAERAAADHVVSATTLSDGVLRIGCWSASNRTFQGDSGPMVYVIVNVSPDMLSGMYEVVLSGGVITRSSGRTIEPKESTARVYIGDYTVPTVDYSSPVNISEQPTATAYKIRNTTSEKLLSLNNAKGTVTIEEADDSNPDQTFYLEPDFYQGEGCYQLRGNSGRYVAIEQEGWWNMKITVSDKPSTSAYFKLDEKENLKYVLTYDWYQLCARGSAAGSTVTLDWSGDLSEWQFFTIPVDHTDYLSTLMARASEWKGLTQSNYDRDLRRALHDAQLIIDGCDTAHVDTTIETLIDAVWAARTAWKNGDTSVAENEWGDPEHVLEGDYVVAYVDAAGQPHYMTIEGGAVQLTDAFSTFHITDGNTIGGDNSTTPYAPYASYMESNGYYLSNPANAAPQEGTFYTISTQAVDGDCGRQHRTWESQVFFYNPLTDLYAIRLTNSTGTAWGPDFYAYVNPSTLEVSAAARSLDEALRTWTILRRDRAVARFLTTSGSCGTNAKWNFDTNTGILSIYGSGRMTNYTSAESVPWHTYADLITTVVVSGSIERLGNRCFNGCTSMHTLVLASSVKPLIGAYTFRDVPKGLVVKVPSLTDYEGYGTGDEYLNGCVLTTLLDLPVTYTYSGSKQKAEAFEGSYGITTPDLKLEKDCGSYNIETTATITVGGSTSSFAVTYSYAITPATLIVRPRDYTRNYGAKNPTFYISYEGLMGNESSSTLDKKATCSCEATPTSPVGDYVVTCSGAEAKNYVFVYETSTLTVRPVKLRVKADNVSRYYGEENPDFTFTWTGFVNDEDISVVTDMPVAEADADRSSDAGTYSITLTGGSAPNYTLSYTSGTLTILALPQTIEWNQSSATMAVGSTLQLSAVSSLGLPVSYTLTTDDVAILVDGLLTFVHEGEVTVTASQSGDTNHAAADPVTRTFRVVSVGIDELDALQGDNACFDLSGRRIDGITKGFVLRCGKKAFLR